MGKLTADGVEEATASVGTLAAVAAGAWVAPGRGKDGIYNVSVWGSFTGSLAVEYSFDGGATSVPALNMSGSPAVFTAPGSCLGQQPEAGVLVRLNATALSAGTANWRISR